MLVVVVVVVPSLSRIQLFATPWLQCTRLPCPSLSLGVCSNSCPLSQWWYPTISFSVVPFCSNLLSFPASGSFPMSQLFPSGVLVIRASTSASALSMNACFSSWLTFLVSKCKILYLCDGFTLWDVFAQFSSAFVHRGLLCVCVVQQSASDLDRDYSQTPKANTSFILCPHELWSEEYI